MKGWLATALIVIGSSMAGTGAVQAYSAMYIFGDSLSDSGNLYAASMGSAPDPAYYPQGRFQNGPSMVEYVASALGVGDDARARLAGTGGSNYAVGEARSRYHANDLDPVTGLAPALGGGVTPLSLLWQVGLYLQDSGGVANPNALYTVWSGGNDLRDELLLRALAGDAAATQYREQAASDIGDALLALIGAGARHLLVPTLPQLGVVPLVASFEQVVPGTIAAGNAYADALNALVDAQISTLPSTGVAVHRLPVGAWLEEIHADALSLGFTNRDDPCLSGVLVTVQPGSVPSVCNDPGSYYFWDGLHPTSEVHAQLATRVNEALPEPGALALIAAGLLCVRLTQRR